MASTSLVGNRRSIEYEGSNFLRLRLVLSTLSGRPVRIRNIRAKSTMPGLTESEACLIRLFDKITNGSKIEVNETGTSLFYQPGLLIGGKVDHQCSHERSLGYYLEPLMCLGAFCKNPLEVNLHGVTNNQSDPSPDLLKYSAMPVLKRFFIVDDGLELKIIHRGAAPGGGGHVLFRCPIRKELKAQQLTELGKIKRIRGVAWACKVSPAISNRCVESCKGMLLKFIPDIYIYADHASGKKSGKSPGFGVVLSAETTSGAVLSAEITSKPASSSEGGPKQPTVPESLGLDAAKFLLEEIFRGGCVDSTSQSLALLLAALGPKDVSRVVTGPLSDYTVAFLRHLKDFFEVVFKLEKFSEAEDGEELNLGADKILLTCVGVGYTNLSKRTT